MMVSFQQGAIYDFLNGSHKLPETSIVPRMRYDEDDWKTVRFAI